MTPATAQNVGSLCLGLHVRRATRQLTRLYDAALAPVDLTIGQFSLMTMLLAQESMMIQPIADALGMDRSSVTAALKPLERRGLVISSPDPKDRRLRHLALSSAGAALMDTAHERWRAAQHEAEASLGSAQTADAFRLMLNKFR